MKGPRVRGFADAWVSAADPDRCPGREVPSSASKRTFLNPPSEARSCDAVSRCESSYGLVARMTSPSLRGRPRARPKSLCHPTDHRSAPVACSQRARTPLIAPRRVGDDAGRRVVVVEVARAERDEHATRSVSRRELEVAALFGHATAESPGKAHANGRAVVRCARARGDHAAEGVRSVGDRTRATRDLDRAHDCGIEK